MNMRNVCRSLVWLIMGMAAVGCGNAPSPEAETVSTSVDEIQGGVFDPDDPAVGAIYLPSNQDTNVNLCTGTLIAPSYVLTANHCAFSTSSATFVLGSVYAEPTAMSDVDDKF